MSETRQASSFPCSIAVARFCVAILIAGCGQGALAAADRGELPPSATATASELTGLIQSQIRALSTADFTGAYQFAAAGIREKFDLGAFTAMVRASYPELLQARVVQVTEVRDNRTQASATVRIVTMAGRIAYFRYVLERDASDWKVVGVVPFQPPTTNA